jgi:uncharacterized protein YabN with tetrapyrrole methylase and pyrophosphatase domain
MTDEGHKLMVAARKLDTRRIEGNYGPRKAPGGSTFYDWLNACLDELHEVAADYKAGNLDGCRGELGDVQANLVQLALFLKIPDPLTAGLESCNKVNRRLDYVEVHASEGTNAELWDRCKLEEKTR